MNKTCSFNLYHTNHVYMGIIFGEYKKSNKSSVSNKLSPHNFQTNSFKSFLYSSTSTSTLNNPSANTQHSSRVFDNVNSSSTLFVDPISGIPIVFRKDNLETFPMNSKEEASEAVIFHNLKFLTNNSILKESDLVVRLCELWISNFGDPEDEHHSLILLGQYLRKCNLDDDNIDYLMNQVNTFGSEYSKSKSSKNSFFNRQEQVEKEENNIDRLLTCFKAYPYIQIEQDEY